MLGTIQKHEFNEEILKLSKALQQTFDHIPLVTERINFRGKTKRILDNLYFLIGAYEKKFDIYEDFLMYAILGYYNFINGHLWIARNDFKKAIQIAEKNNDGILPILYFNFGFCSHRMFDVYNLKNESIKARYLEDAKRFYKKAKDYSKEQNELSIDILNRLGLVELSSDTERDGSIEFFDVAQTLAIDLNYREGEGFSYLGKSIWFFAKTNYVMALDKVEEALKRLKSKQNRASAYITLGWTLWHISKKNLRKAIVFLRVALKYASEITDYQMMVTCCRGLQRIHEESGNKAKAGKYKKLAEDYLEDLLS